MQSYYVEHMEPSRTDLKISTAHDAARIARIAVARWDRETMVVIGLDDNGSAAVVRRLATGTRRSVPLSPAAIVATATEFGCATVILAHTHPNGNHEPSVTDVEVTAIASERVAEAGITLLDHLVLTKSGRASSLRQLGLMPAT